MKIPQGFNYSGAIPTPAAMEVSGTGSMEQMRKNVNALLNYGTVLSDGCSAPAREKGLCKANRELESAAAEARAEMKEGFTPDIYPLGDKYFLKTSSTCKDKDGKEHDRYIYINNVPTGKIDMGFGKVGGGGDGAMRGLIPSLVEDMSKLNPLSLMRAFSTDSKGSKCKKVNLGTIDSQGKTGREEHYMTLDDIVDLDPFVGSRGEFVKFNNKLKTGTTDTIVPSAKIDAVENLYIFGFSVFVIFLISKMAYK